MGRGQALGDSQSLRAMGDTARAPLAGVRPPVEPGVEPPRFGPVAVVHRVALEAQDLGDRHMLRAVGLALRAQPAGRPVGPGGHPGDGLGVCGAQAPAGPRISFGELVEVADPDDGGGEVRPRRQPAGQRVVGRDAFGESGHEGPVLPHPPDAPGGLHGDRAEALALGESEELVRGRVGPVGVDDLGVLVEPVLDDRGQDLGRALAARHAGVSGVAVLRQAEVLDEPLFFEPLEGPDKALVVLDLGRVVVAVVELHVVEIAESRPLQDVLDEGDVGFLVDAPDLVVALDAVDGHLADVGLAVPEDRLGRPVPRPLLGLVPVVHPAQDARLARGFGQVARPDDDRDLASAVPELPAGQSAHLGRGLLDGVRALGPGPAGKPPREPEDGGRRPPR